VQYFCHRPSPPLDQFVAYLWMLHDTPDHSRERIVASGTLELVLNLRDDEFRIQRSSESERYERYSGAIVSGAYGGAGFVIDTRQHASVAGVHFKPGGARPFIGMPPGELADRHIDLETLWGRAAAGELRERLCAAATVAQRFRIMEQALTTHLSRRSFDLHPAVPPALRALEADVTVTMRALARQVGLSQRRFIEIFAAHVGMTPKLFCRIRRFQRAMSRARSSNPPHLAQLALRCGYYDQAHLIHDFREFSGLRPTEYLQRRHAPVKENHLPLTT
jgi:AraC-like DNA-binding protein